jgi:hypothetical protein
LKEKLTSHVERGGKGDAEAKAVTDMKVRLGPAPFTWLVRDGMREYLLSKRDTAGAMPCPCGQKPCLHVLAVERFTAAQPSEAGRCTIQPWSRC